MTAKRLMAAAATVGMAVSMMTPAWAGTYYLENGDITVEGYADGNYVSQNTDVYRDDGEIIIKQNEQGNNETATSNTLTIKSSNDDAPDAIKDSVTETVEMSKEAAEGENSSVTVTIDDINIDVSSNGEAAISVKGDGDVTLELDGENEVKSGTNHAGVEKNDSDGTGTLSIDDADEDGGSLKATGGECGAGIGGGLSQSSSNLVIEGGDIDARGFRGAGIGGGGGLPWDEFVSGDGTVVINGGNVKATGGDKSAGIGGGGGETFGGNGNVTINGGNINATGGEHGAGIGGGEYGNGMVTINGGEVDATGGDDGGVSIGGGNGTVTLKDGTVTKQPYGSLNDSHKSHVFSGEARRDGCAVIKTCACGSTQTTFEHTWDNGVVTTEPTYTTEGVKTYTCTVDGCGVEKTESIPMLEPEENSADPAPMGMTDQFGAPIAYEQSVENGRVVFAAPAENAVLTGSLAALAELKAQGADTIVFRTPLKETALSIDWLLAQGSADDVFALAHKGTEVRLTVAGWMVRL